MTGKRSRDDEGGHSQSPKKARHGFRVGPDNLPDGTWRRKVIKIKKDLITKAKVKKQYAKVKADLEKQQNPTISEEEQQPQPSNDDAAQSAPETAIHPSRQALLDDPSADQPQSSATHPASRPPRQPRQPRNIVSGENQTEIGARQPRPRSPTPPPQKEGEEAEQTNETYTHHDRRQQHQRRRPGYFEKELAEAERKKAEADARAAEIARREAEKKQRIAERERYRKAMAKAKAPGHRDGKRKIGRESGILLDRVKRLVAESG